LRPAHAALAGLAAALLVACNAIFGLDPLTYEPRPSIPLLDDAGDGEAGDAGTSDAGTSDADTSDADTSDASTGDAG